MNLIEHLSEEIAKQSRNGRTDMYIETVLLKELGYTNIEESDRQFIDRATLETLMRKYKEMFLAFRLEKFFTKEDILAMYLNRAYFGAGRYGIKNASEFYFNKLFDLGLGKTFGDKLPDENFYL